MRLYHFTAAHLVEPILANGIRFGRIPRTLVKATDDRSSVVGVEVGWQWLTVNPEFAAQVWDTGGSLPYRRNDFRFTVEIPDRAAGQVFHWLTFCKPLNDPIHVDMNSDGHPENWFLFKGDIDRRWIKGVDPNPCILAGCKKRRPRIFQRVLTGRLRLG